MGSSGKEVTGGAATVELPRGDDPADPDHGAEHLPRIPYGVYETGEEIGRGGLGRVIRAVDTRLKRPVAIKELLAERASSERRFAREAFITARLEHPAIVSVHEAGRWPNGQPFYAMKLISGRSLAEIIKDKATLTERLELVPRVIAAAEGIAYAHSRRVIHRDIKPDNVILGNFGETVVIDWGLAKVVGDADERSGALAAAAADHHTVAGSVLGTPSYMPPEQARGDAVDERADVYALGALLYHVLAGAPPYRTPRAGSSSAAVLGPAREPSVSRPASAVLADVLGGPPLPLAVHVPHAPRDLITILDKAMARDPAARYPTAREMADDLHRFQTGQLVSARHYSRAELARRWVARHQAVVLVAAGALLVLAAGGAAAIRRVVVARGEAEARRNELILAQAGGALERDPTATLAWLAQLPPDGDWRAAQALAADAWSRGFARRVWRRHAAGVWTVAVSHDGKHAASASADGTVVIHDLDGPGATYLVGHAAEVNTVAFSPDGTRLASGGDDGRIVIWRAGQAERTFAGHEGSVTGVEFTPDGKSVLSIGYDRTVRLWDVASGAGRILGSHGGKGQALAVSPDGKLVATVADGDPLTLWDLTSGERRAIGPVGLRSIAVAFAPAGDAVAIAAPAGGMVAVYALDGVLRRTLPGDASAVMTLAYSRDGHRLAAGATDKLVHVFDLGSGSGRWLGGHDGTVRGVAFTPSGELVSGAGDRSVRVWVLPSLDERVVATHPGGVRGVVFRAGRVVSAGEDGIVRAGPQELLAGLAPVNVLAGDGDTLAAGGADGSLRVIRGEHTEKLDGGHEAVTAVAVRGGEVAWVADDGLLRLRGPGGRADVPARDGENVAFTPDGRTLLWTNASELRSCAVADCAGSARTIERQTAWIRALAVSPDGGWVASGGGEGALHVGELAAASFRVLAGHESSIARLAFSPDGKRIASGAQDGEVRLWDLAAGTSRPLHGHGRNVTGLAFSRDGLRLATASVDRTARVWDLATGRSRLLLGHEDRIDAMAFAPDGATLATGSKDGSVRVWQADPGAGVPAGAEELRRWVSTATNARIGPDGALMTTDGSRPRP